MDSFSHSSVLHDAGELFMLVGRKEDASPMTEGSSAMRQFGSVQGGCLYESL